MDSSETEPDELGSRHGRRVTLRLAAIRALDSVLSDDDAESPPL